MRARSKTEPVDPTIYPEEERVGENMCQRRITELLRPLLERWLNSRRKTVAFVGADQFIYWRQYSPRDCVSPDIYVLPGVDPKTEVGAWKVWIDEVVPSLAIEVVSDEWKKDYYQAPNKYDELGVGELVIFDPGFDTHPEGLRWQVYRRVGKRGLVRVEATNRDRVRSKALGCWLRAVGKGADLRLRIAEGKDGEKLVPTAEDREQAERAAKEAERAAKEAERAAKEAALARMAELEREIARLKGRKR
jgi:Uma2 family endonuclease